MNAELEKEGKAQKIYPEDIINKNLQLNVDKSIQIDPVILGTDHRKKLDAIIREVKRSFSSIENCD